MLITQGVDAYPARRPETWDAAVCQQLTLRTVRAIGNEVQLTIDQSDALVTVPSEDVTRDTFTTTSDDQLGNPYINTISVVSATTGSGLLPTEPADFLVDRINGKIEWKFAPGLTSNTPLDTTTYNVTYTYRLDDQIRIVVKQVKPIQRSVVIIFANSNADLPKAIEI